MASRKGATVVIGLAALVAGVWLFYQGLKNYSLKKAIEYTPTSKAVSAVPGLTEVSGIARPYAGKKLSPYDKKECLYYATEIWKWSGSGKHRRKTLEKRIKSDDPILIEDKTGTILVQATIYPSSSKSRAYMRTDVSKSSRPGGLAGLFWQSDPNDKLKPFLCEFCPNLAEYGDKIEVYETYIQDGDPIYVLGKAEIFDPNEPRPRLIVKDDKRTGIYCISDGTEKGALSRVGQLLNAMVFGCPLLAFAGFEFAVLGLVMEFGAKLSDVAPLMFAGLIIPVLLYIWLAWTLFTAAYNGLILLKNQINRSRANVDTFLLKRHDLLPNLVKVVQEYAKYERAMQEMVASLRSAKVGESGKILFAVSESYPDLKANENFLALQKELVGLEDQIAGSREYYNDAVMLYNKQIATFPHLIVAKALNLKPIEYYSVGEQELKAAPGVFS